MHSADLNDFPAGHYGTILSDPPWQFANYSGPSVPQRAKEQHYQTMTVAEMATLPVEQRAAKDCVLLMWAVGSHLKMAIELGEAWGFAYKTDGFYWLKQRMFDAANQIDWIDGDMEEPIIGLGKWTRKQVEMCLLFTRGKPRRLSGGVAQVIISPRREHSRKPDEQYERIEALCGGPRLEMFGRRQRAGWDTWGNQVA